MLFKFVFVLFRGNPLLVHAFAEVDEEGCLLLSVEVECVGVECVEKDEKGELPVAEGFFDTNLSELETGAFDDAGRDGGNFDHVAVDETGGVVVLDDEEKVAFDGKVALVAEHVAHLDGELSGLFVCLADEDAVVVSVLFDVVDIVVDHVVDVGVKLDVAATAERVFCPQIAVAVDLFAVGGGGDEAADLFGGADEVVSFGLAHDFSE